MNDNFKNIKDVEVKEPVNYIKMFGIYDKKAENLFDTFKAVDIVSANRMFEGSVNDPKSMLNKYSEDYDLVFLTQTNGKTLQVEVKNITIASASEVKREVSNDRESVE